MSMLVALVALADVGRIGSSLAGLRQCDTIGYGRVQRLLKSAAGKTEEEVGAPNGIRIRAAGLKGRCPRPLDDGGTGRGGPHRARTCDLGIKSPLLYHLS
jgi:hypothetical protein